MPRNNDIYSLPPGWQAVTGTPISSVKYNLALSDIADDLNWLTGYTQQSAENVEGLEIGRKRPAGEAYVDLHTTGNPATDYTARIIRQTGANGNLNIIQTGAGHIDFLGGGFLLRNGALVWTDSNSPSKQWNIVGSLVFAYNNSGATIGPSETVAGSAINAAGISGGTLVTSLGLAGTWRCLGYAPAGFLTLFTRIA